MADLDLPFGHANLLLPLLFPRSGCGCVCVALRVFVALFFGFLGVCVGAAKGAAVPLSARSRRLRLCRARAGLRSGSVMHLIIGCLHSKSSYICCPRLYRPARTAELSVRSLPCSFCLRLDLAPGIDHVGAGLRQQF